MKAIMEEPEAVKKDTLTVINNKTFVSPKQSIDNDLL